MRDKSSLSEEDLQWELENPLPDSPGLFSKSPMWFKHSAYDMKDIKGNLYICPTPGATLIPYKPFEKFPQILVEFIELLIGLNEIREKAIKDEEIEFERGLYKNKSEEDEIKSIKSTEMKRANLLLNFISKHGPLGIMYEYIESVHPCRIGDSDDFEDIIVKLNERSYSDLHLQDKILPSHTKEGIFNFTPIIKYTDLCSHFLLNAKEPYPEIRSKGFKEKYSEMVNEITNNYHIYSLTRHVLRMNEYFVNNYNPSDNVPDKSNTKWSHYLRQSCGEIGLTFGFDKETNKWDLNWNFKSLIGALSIMYIMNLTGKMGSEVHICKHPKCNRIVVDRNCCTQHDDAYRKAKSREMQKRTIIEEFVAGESIENLSAKYKKPITQISKWLKDSDIEIGV